MRAMWLQLSRDVIARGNSFIVRCDCSYPALLRVKQSRDVSQMCHSYRVMWVIYRAMWPTSCTMWSSLILKQTAYHRKATARLQGRRESERERRRFKFKALATRQQLLNYGTSLTIMWQGRLRACWSWWPSDGRMYAGFRYGPGMTAHS